MFLKILQNSQNKPEAWNFIKKDAGIGVFLCFAKFLKALFKDNLWWLLLIIHPPKICSGEAVLHVLEITKKLKRMPEM